MQIVAGKRFLGGPCFCGTLLTVIALSAVASRSLAEVTFTTQHALVHTEFDGLYSDTDLIHGRSTLDVDVFENPGDLGWHSANTDPADQIAALTDGIGFRPGSNLTGLLNDLDPPTTGVGIPVKVVEYPFTSPVDIGRINLFTGNRLNADGRIFSTTVVEYSTDNAFSFQPLGYFQSDPSGTINNEISPVPPLDPAHEMTLVSIFDDTSSTLVSGVTNIIFTFYSVDNTGGQVRDPFDGVNPFTGIDDGLSAAFVSPLVLEIDVLAPTAGVVGDYNGNGNVDTADYVVWRDNLGADTLLNRDDTITGPVGEADYNAWAARYGNTSGSGSGAASPATVPEPATTAISILGMGVLITMRCRIMSHFASPPR